MNANAALLRKLNEEIDNSRRVRNLAWFEFEEHRDSCKLCDGHSYQTILSGKSYCETGTNLAISVDLAHDTLRRA